MLEKRIAGLNHLQLIPTNERSWRRFTPLLHPSPDFCALDGTRGWLWIDIWDEA
jgi:hypothetical protein